MQKKNISLTPFSIPLLATLICIYGYCNIRIRGHTRTPTPLPYTHTHTHTHTQNKNATNPKEFALQFQGRILAATQHKFIVTEMNFFCCVNELLLLCDVIQSGKYELSFRKKKKLPPPVHQRIHHKQEGSRFPWVCGALVRSKQEPEVYNFS